MKQITVKDFKGINIKEGLWDQGFSAFTTGVDIYGLGDDVNKISVEGVAQQALQLSSMAIATANNNITSAIADISYFNVDNHVYAIDISNNARVYRWNQSVPNWVYVSSIATSGIGSHLAQYNNQLFYSSNNYLGYYDGTNSTAAFAQLPSGNTLPTPMKVFSGYLFIASGRYVDRYDGSSYQSKKLILPIDFTIRSMEVFRDGLYISADNGFFSRIFIWDGSSPTYTDYIPLPNEAAGPSLQASQGFIWVIGNRGTQTNAITSLTPIYIIQYGAPELLFELPIFRDSSFTPGTGTAAYQNGVLIGSSPKAPVTADDFPCGVWFVGKDLSTGLFHATNLFPLDGLGSTISAIFSSGSTQTGQVGPAMYTALSGSNGFQMYQAASSSVCTPTYTHSIWRSLPIDAGSTARKSWTSIKLSFDGLTTGQTLIVRYRLDSDVSMTTLKTFTPDTAGTPKPLGSRFMQIPIGRTSRTITVEFELNTTSSTSTFQVHSFSIIYEPTGE